MFPRIILLPLALSCLVSIASLSAQTPQARPLPLLPRTTPQGVEGGFWRMDGSFDPVLHLKNVLLKQPLDVTPEIFFADGTEYDLPVVHLDPAGVASVDIKIAVGSLPPAIAPHVSTYGMVGISYQWSWSAVLASIQNTDEIASLSGASAPLGRKSVVHQTPEAIAPQVIRSTWWRPTQTSDEIIALGNTSLRAKQVQLQVSDSGGAQIAERRVEIESHATALLHLNDLLSGSGNAGNAGDITIRYSGASHAVVASASIEDGVSGFSFTPHMVERVAHPDETEHRVTLHAPGLMLGKPDTTMLFPVDTVFMPYVVLHNVSNHPITATLSLTSNGTGGTPVTRSLNSIPMASGTTLKVDMSRYFNSNTPLPNGYGHLSVAFTGRNEDLLFDVGSVDQSLNYVFQVMPSAEAPTTSKVFCFWSIDDDTSTMISIWNYANKSQDATLTLYYSGGQYRIPLHLGPRQTYNLDMMTLVRSQKPDPDGNLIPGNITTGSAALVGPGGELDRMTVVTSASTYNVRNATCWPVCLNCGGLTSLYMDPDITWVVVNGWNLATASFTTSSGGPYNVGSSGTWSTQNTSIATVDGTGNVHGGQAAGSTTLLAEMSAPLGEMQCYYSEQTMCEDQSFEGSGPANVGPAITSISPSTIPLGGTGVQVTISGSGFGTSPTLNLPAGVTASGQRSSDTQIVVTLTAAFSATIGYAAVSVTAGGQISNTKQIIVNGPAYATVASDTMGQFTDGTVVRIVNYHVYNFDGSGTIIFPIAEVFSATHWSCTNAPQPSTTTTACNGQTSTNNGLFSDEWSYYGTYYTPPNCGAETVIDHWQWCAPSAPNPGKTFMTLSGFIHTTSSNINGYENPPNAIPSGMVFNP